jgi:hypothetical protein
MFSALQCDIHVVDLISHVTLNIIIWHISKIQGEIKHLFLKLQFNKNHKLRFIMKLYLNAYF